ncbi:hypothetical protein HMEPL2_13020 [Vreelandella aquamarina]|jgi:hypothetical protein|uniref:Uncharacterized protein n=1 Tax=Vreelandella aquamarina TaxID=77097 RepID=A0A1N6FKT3_9GAMM|nr:MULTISPECIES: hypothetical protein [Halomonas]PHR00655.1 MAG: hypothetical protein COB32_12145 [Halomonas sp.]SIN61604.1 hypothetical protein SAMN05878249_0706 [Halomonas meridiana]SIN67122.1 hypothetical protein SAMN05878438_2137 [Halomonas meridiana]SIN95882.1 hypothetical protein SAMN05878442_0252 [Halomonas meridiana]BCB70951.1 hypothetical protein HMEPL2_13020 [Halomonas meridiana]|tara:strand:- start:461 stop:811 length:351 start_codon:yes stop_codon:yes gene_type:complete
MSHSHATSPLAAPIRALLTQAPASALPMTYQQVANTLGLTPPRTIARVAQALEQLMEEDVAAGRPMIAALVISRRGEDLPASGFFEKAVALGRFPSAPAQHSARYAEEREQALRAR